MGHVFKNVIFASMLFSYVFEKLFFKCNILLFLNGVKMLHFYIFSVFYYSIVVYIYVYVYICMFLYLYIYM